MDGAVGVLAIDLDRFFVTNRHSRNGDVQAWNDLAAADGEFQRIAAFAAVKDSAVIQCACVVNTNGVTRFCLGHWSSNLVGKSEFQGRRPSAGTWRWRYPDDERLESKPFRDKKYVLGLASFDPRA